MSKEKRQDSVDKFQNNDKIKIFISNIIAGGVGITLTAAETVIMNDLSFVLRTSFSSRG
jgi:SNF2 family DNA or RNA helicase